MFPLPASWPHALVHLVLSGAGLWLAASSLRERPTLRRALGLLAALVACGLGLGVFTAPSTGGTFGLLLAWSWTLGLALPASAFVFAGILRSRREPWGWLIAIGVLCTAVTLQAFWVEPHRLAVTRVQLPQRELRAPLRIALIADLQTDRPGTYEREALRAVMQERPDLILFAGDYIQADDDETYRAQWAALRELIREVGLRAPLGVYGVQGDQEWREGWAAELRGTGIELLPPPPRARSIRSDVVLSGLPLDPSGDPSVVLSRPRGGALHVVLGHRPDFALGRVDADLLLAGHTHGGQVQIPGFGPLVTLSEVPRAWAAGGVHPVDDDTTLVVSRGVGMERSNAPRVRFWCRPEIVILDLTPAPRTPA